MSALTFQRASSNEILFRLLVFTLACSTLIVTTSFLDPVNLPKLVAITALLPALILYLLKEMGFPSVSVRDLPRLIFLASILVIVLFAFISPAPVQVRFLGINGRNNGLLTNLVCLVIAWCAYEVSRNGVQPLRFCLWAHHVLLAAGLYGLMQVFGVDPVAWSASGFSAFATFGNPNFASAAWGLGAMCSSSILFFGRRTYAKSKVFLVFFLLTLSTFLFLALKTESIQGLFAFAAFLTLITIFYLWSKKRFIYRTISLIPVVLGAVIAHSIYFVGPLSSYIVSAGNLELRKWYWNIGWNIFLDHPLLGAGVDSYGDFFRSTRSEEMVSSTYAELFTNNAHNSFIQILATIGIIGGVGIIIPVVFTLLLSLRHVLRSSTNPSMAAIAIFLALWLNAAFSIDNISIALWNWLFLGITLGSIRANRTSAPTKEQNSKRGATSSSASGPVIQILALMSSVAVFVYLMVGVTSADRKLGAIQFSGQVPENQKAAFDAFNKERLRVLDSLSSDRYLNAFHYFNIGKTYAELGQTQKAVNALRTGLEKYPNDYNLINLLAEILEVRGRTIEAIEMRKLQASLDPYYAIPWAALAGAYFKLGDDVNGRKASETAYRLIPLLTESSQENVRQFLEQFE